MHGSLVRVAAPDGRGHRRYSYVPLRRGRVYPVVGCGPLREPLALGHPVVLDRLDLSPVAMMAAGSTASTDLDGFDLPGVEAPDRAREGSVLNALPGLAPYSGGVGCMIGKGAASTTSRLGSRTGTKPVKVGGTGQPVMTLGQIAEGWRRPRLRRERHQGGDRAVPRVRRGCLQGPRVTAPRRLWAARATARVAPTLPADTGSVRGRRAARQ